jgi:hypothetical protein
VPETHLFIAKYKNTAIRRFHCRNTNFPRERNLATTELKNVFEHIPCLRPSCVPEKVGVNQKGTNHGSPTLL